MLTAVFVLRFRVWERPMQGVAYFVFFAVLDFTAMWLWVPPGAFGPGLGFLCLALTVPAVVAIVLVRRHEQYERD